MNSIPVLPDRLDWASAIGLFIINFGMLDLHIQDFLESAMPREEFLRIKERPFYDRVELIREHVSQAGYAPEKIKGFEQLFFRIDPLRDLRNHIAHGIMRITLAPDRKTFVQTLSLPRDLDGSDSPAARHLEFAELQDALGTLTELIEKFQHLAGFRAADRVAVSQLEGKAEPRT